MGGREERGRRRKRRNIAGIPSCLDFLLKNIGDPAAWWKKVVKNNSYILSSLESLLIFPGALCQSCCLCSVIRVAENCDLSITNLFSSDLRRVLLAAFRDV